MNWYQGPSLVDAINQLKPPQRLIDKPFRMAASDVFKPNTGSGIAVAGRIESGFIMANDKVLGMVSNNKSLVKFFGHKHFKEKILTIYVIFSQNFNGFRYSHYS